MISTFNLVKLHSLLEDFYKLTNIRITVFDEDFNELIAYPDELTTFCQIVRADKHAYEECKKCDARACEMAAKQRKSFTYQCHAGMTESIAPLFLGNIVIGYLLFGQVLSYNSYEQAWNKIKRLCNGYQIDMKQLEIACCKQPLIQNDFIESASHILQAVAYYLCLERMVSLHQQELPVQIDEYLSMHFAEDINVSTLCKEFQIGKTHLYEITKQNYGVGLAEHIRNLRINKAKDLLENHPNMTLADIAFSCGFKDYNYFITVFKRIVGTSPKKYQKINKTLTRG